MPSRSYQRYSLIGTAGCLLLILACLILVVLDQFQVDSFWRAHGIQTGQANSRDHFVVSQFQPGMSRDQVHKKMEALGRVDFSPGADVGVWTTEDADLWTGLISRRTYIFFYDSQDKLVKVLVVS